MENVIIVVEESPKMDTVGSVNKNDERKITNKIRDFEWLEL